MFLFIRNFNKFPYVIPKRSIYTNIFISFNTNYNANVIFELTNKDKYDKYILVLFISFKIKFVLLYFYFFIYIIYKDYGVQF